MIESKQFREFKDLLASRGYNYGEDAAENAFVGYELALEEVDGIRKELAELKWMMEGLQK